MSSMLLAISAARGARCNQTLSFFRKAGARLAPPLPLTLPPSLPPSKASSRLPLRPDHRNHPPRLIILSISISSHLHHDPRPRGTSSCLYHSILRILPVLLKSVPIASKRLAYSRQRPAASCNQHPRRTTHAHLLPTIVLPTFYPSRTKVVVSATYP